MTNPNINHVVNLIYSSWDFDKYQETQISGSEAEKTSDYAADEFIIHAIKNRDVKQYIDMIMESLLEKTKVEMLKDYYGTIINQFFDDVDTANQRGIVNDYFALHFGMRPNDMKEYLEQLVKDELDNN